MLKNSFVLAALFFMCSFAQAQNQFWASGGFYYGNSFSSTTVQHSVLHGIGVQGRYVSFPQNAKVGFYMGLSIEYTLARNYFFLSEFNTAESTVPVQFGFLMAPAFKFPLSKTVDFYIAPGAHAAFMPEFAFGIGFDAGFSFFPTNRFFISLGVTGAFHFVGVDFFRGGNLKQYISTTVQPAISFGWRGFTYPVPAN